MINKNKKLISVEDFIIWEQKEYNRKISKAFDQLQFRLELGIKAI